jgi:CheY-like chemotaxis protein
MAEKRARTLKGSKAEAGATAGEGKAPRRSAERTSKVDEAPARAAKKAVAKTAVAKTAVAKKAVAKKSAAKKAVGKKAVGKKADAKKAVAKKMVAKKADAKKADAKKAVAKKTVAKKAVAKKAVAKKATAPTRARPRKEVTGVKRSAVEAARAGAAALRPLVTEIPESLAVTELPSSEAPTLLPQRAEPQRLFQRSKDVHILVVDDEEEVLELLVPFLRKKGYSVTQAHDGDQALEKILTERPHIVVLDVMMPGSLSGWEIARYVRERAELDPVRIIMATGIGKETNAATSPLYGADAYLDKPFALDELERTVAEVIRRIEEQVARS